MVTEVPKMHGNPKCINAANISLPFCAEFGWHFLNVKRLNRPVVDNPVFWLVWSYITDHVTDYKVCISSKSWLLRLNTYENKATESSCSLSWTDGRKWPVNGTGAPVVYQGVALLPKGGAQHLVVCGFTASAMTLFLDMIHA